MRCPNCKQVLANNISSRINFCPMCGARLYDEKKGYLVHIYSVGQREASASDMLVFVDEKNLYEAKQGNGVLIRLAGGFHTIKFRCGVRSKAIQLLLDADYDIKAYYNSLTGLIETSVVVIEGTEDGHTALNISDDEITKPTMVSETGERGFDSILGEDEPEYEIKATSGLLEGKLKLYSDRIEFFPSSSTKNEVIEYTKIQDVKKKMGAIDIQCAGNVHKVYSIPKDIYNEVMVFLTNKIEEVQS